MLQNCSITAGCNSNNPLLNTTFCLLQLAVIWATDCCIQYFVFEQYVRSKIYIPIVFCPLTVMHEISRYWKAKSFLRKIMLYISSTLSITADGGAQSSSSATSTASSGSSVGDNSVKGESGDNHKSHDHKLVSCAPSLGSCTHSLKVIRTDRPTDKACHWKRFQESRG